MARSCWPARRRAPAIWVGNSNGTSGRVGVQNSSLSKLLRCNWNLEKSIATGTHNSKPLELERRLAAPTVKHEPEELGKMTRRKRTCTSAGRLSQRFPRIDAFHRDRRIP